MRKSGFLMLKALKSPPHLNDRYSTIFTMIATPPPSRLHPAVFLGTGSVVEVAAASTMRRPCTSIYHRDGKGRWCAPRHEAELDPSEGGTTGGVDARGGRHRISPRETPDADALAAVPSIRRPRHPGPPGAEYPSLPGISPKYE